jgi:hypothetical protein
LFDPRLRISFDSPGFSTKAAALQRCADTLGIPYRDVLYIGDQPADYDAAHQAGTSFLGVTYGWGIAGHDNAFPTVDSPEEIGDYVLNMKWAEDSVELSLAPLQGHWTEEQYLLLTDQTGHLVEFADGYVEVLPMPTDSYQVILRFIFLALHAFLSPHGGAVLFAPLRVRIREDKFREPDCAIRLH